MKFHFDEVQDLAGFAVENAKAGDTIRILTRALLTSDDPEFYEYSEKISSIFLNKAVVQIDGVYKFLVIIHQDHSADLYVNKFAVSVEIKTKRDMKAGEVLMRGDIADIRKVKFPHIEIKDTDKVIYCFKVGWRFGLFFDLAPRSHPIETQKLDIEKMQLAIGELLRRLAFHHVYKVLEWEAQFDEMMKDGWFPFIEILAGEYKKLTEAYQNKFDFENKVKAIVDSFDKNRIKTRVFFKYGETIVCSSF